MLAASLVCNLLLGLAARHYYISAKLRAAEPTFVQHYSRQNLTVQATRGISSSPCSATRASPPGTRLRVLQDMTW